jgi:hypothetical protein
VVAVAGVNILQSGITEAFLTWLPLDAGNLLHRSVNGLE